MFTVPCMTRHRHGARVWSLVKKLLLSALLAVIATMGLQTTLQAPASADPSTDVWAKLRMCESSDRYHVNTGTGYYGAYQFDMSTWRSVGGAGRPDQASPAEQDYRALYLYRTRGWQPWECAGMLGLHNDGDARSKNKPSYADSRYMGGDDAPAPTPPAPNPGNEPAWPGLVYAYGDCSPALKPFQMRMNAWGYEFTGTGCYYEKTKRAVLDLQRANGINPSGRLGPQTWRAAWDGAAPR